MYSTNSRLVKKGEKKFNKMQIITNVGKLNKYKIIKIKYIITLSFFKVNVVLLLSCRFV